MKDFFSKADYPLILFVLYVVKSVLYPAGINDVYIILILTIPFMFRALLAAFQSLVGVCKYFGDRYLDTKDSIISENQFRAQVNQDIGNLAAEIQSLRMTVANPIQGFGRKR